MASKKKRINYIPDLPDAPEIREMYSAGDKDCEGEKELWAALIRLAVSCVIKQSSRGNKKLREEAEDWLLYKGKKGRRFCKISLEEVCGWLNLEVDVVRRLAKKEIAAGPVRKRGAHYVKSNRVVLNKR